MEWKIVFLTMAALVQIAGSGPQFVSVAHADGCETGAKIDGSTAAEAKKKIESAGFRQVRGLKKGCDNFWHGIAVKDGVETNVVLTPQGQVIPEGG
jgi:hypothetical protein